MSGTYITQDISTRTSVDIYREDGTSSCTTFYESVYQTDYVPWEMNIEIAKSSETSDEGLVSGWASIAINKDGSRPLDWQDDIIQPETLEKAAIDFMLNYQESGVMHTGDSTGTVVESIMFTKEKQAAIGIPEGTVPEGWFITVKIHDPEVFAKVKDKTYKMFSIQGTSSRVQL